MNDSPYTHPSMPGTSYRDYLTEDPRPQYQPSMVEIDLSVDVHPAALEDAGEPVLVEAIPEHIAVLPVEEQGPALVDAIHNPHNPRLIGHNRKHADGSADIIDSSAAIMGVEPYGTDG